MIKKFLPLLRLSRLWHSLLYIWQIYMLFLYFFLASGMYQVVPLSRSHIPKTSFLFNTVFQNTPNNWAGSNMPRSSELGRNTYLEHWLLAWINKWRSLNSQPYTNTSKWKNRPTFSSFLINFLRPDDRREVCNIAEPQVIFSSFNWHSMTQTDLLLLSLLPWWIRIKPIYM